MGALCFEIIAKVGAKYVRNFLWEKELYAFVVLLCIF